MDTEDEAGTDGRSTRWRPRRGSDVSVATAARAWVRSMLPRLLPRRVRPRLHDDVELLVSELTANAVLHAGGVEHIDLSCTDTTLRIAVHDGSSAAVTARGAADPAVDHGRGLILVEALAARWGTQQYTNAGKDVWFELALDR